MNFLHLYLFLCAKIVEAKVSHYSRCYVEFSLCLTTSIDDSPSNSDDKSKLTRSSAGEWCEANSSRLAIIPDETVESAMKKFINDDSAKFDSDVITNCYRFNESSWNWINRQPSEAICPHGIYNTHRYVYLSLLPDVKYSLHGSPATSKRKFICYYVTHNGSCSSGYIIQSKVRCYKFRNENVTWFNARNKCLKEGNDLATFEDGIPLFPSNRNGDYWIGQRKESWDWWNGQEFLDLEYSNWDDGYPHSAEGDCLCLKARTGKWKNCDCSQKYRYVCIQEVTTAITTNTTSSTQVLDNNFTDEASANSSLIIQEPDNFDIQRAIIWVSLAILFAVLTVILSRYAVVTIRKRSTRQEVLHTANSFQPTSSVDDYENLKRECLAELDVYETIEDVKQKNLN